MYRMLVLLCMAAGLFAARPNPTGTWKLNAPKSDFGGGNIAADLAFEMKAQGDELFVTQFAGGEELRFHISTDGRKMTNNVPNATMTSTHKWEGDELVGEVLIEGDGWSLKFNDRLAYSADGKTMTMTRDATGPDGERKQKLIFDKQ